MGTALLLAWTIWQPEASDRATNEALALNDERKFDEAIDKTKDAERLNPLTPDPLLVRAAIDTAANRVDDAQENLERAVIRFPGDPQTWYRLAAFQLGTLDSPEQALETLKGALYLNPHSGPATQAVPRRPRAAAREGRHGPAERQRVASANSVPERRRSDATVEAELVEQAPQRVPREKAQVGRERVGPAAQREVRRRAQRERATPGRSTRRISDRNSCTSRTCSIVSAQSTRSKLPSSKGSGASGSSSAMRASGSRRAARAERDGRHVRGGELRGVELAAEPAVAAAEVERALHVAERVDEAPQRLGRRARLLRHELPELVVVAARVTAELKGYPGLRAISMSVCPNGASRGREPAGSSAVEQPLRRRGEPPPAEGHRVQLGLEAGEPGVAHQLARGDRDVVGRAVHGRPEAEAVGQLESRSHRVPEPGLDRHERAAGAEQALGLDEERRQRPLVDHVVEHEPVEHDVEGLRLVGQLARPGDDAVVELARLAQRADHRLVEVHARHPELRPREQVPARVPAAAHRQDLATGERQAARQQLALAAHLLVVVDLAGGRSAEPVEKVVVPVGLAHQAPRARLPTKRPAPGSPRGSS